MLLVPFRPGTLTFMLPNGRTQRLRPSRGPAGGPLMSTPIPRQMFRHGVRDRFQRAGPGGQTPANNPLYRA
ncbi:hypothetical protein GCM10017708_03120 [Arthrobacter citreus]